jgi:DNA adenine methylase
MARSSTTYKPKWRSGQTTVIRVPQGFAEDVLQYAKKLDSRWSPPCESSLFDQKIDKSKLRRSRVVNVASVPLRSPFRYPGGKTWLVPYVRQWLNSLPRSEVFVEPFAGGAIAALTVAFDDLADHVIIAEIDEYVASVWQTILSGQDEWLAQKILNFDLTLRNVKNALARANRKDLPLKDKAFLTILRNRVQRGGIMAPGAGLVKTGENNRGIGSRWYPETLARRIRDIGRIRFKITFFYGDGLLLLKRFGSERKAAFFLDPPYTKAAKRLYNNWEFDHRALLKTIQHQRAPFLLTYDDMPEISSLADEFGYDKRCVKMKNTHHARKTELLVGKDFKWFDAIEE